MGPLPDEVSASETEIERRRRLLDEIGLLRPTRAEIEALLGVFPSDDGECFGLSWTLLHIIKIGPDWPVWEALDERVGWWIDYLRLRLNNAGMAPPTHE